MAQKRFIHALTLIVTRQRFSGSGRNFTEPAQARYNTLPRAAIRPRQRPPSMGSA
jgi:hypothetical protein